MIKDKVVIITGASSGIGASTARLLGKKGAKLVLAARREDKLKRLVDKIKENGGKTVYRVTDVVDPATIHTELLDTITDPDAEEAMQATYDKYQISPDRVANVVAFAIDQPEDTNVSEFTVGPTNQPW